VLVVDVDVPPAGGGSRPSSAPRDADLAAGWGWLVRTPSGGLHAYYPLSGREQRCWAALSAHIDFRGDGGYVIAPPSRVESEDQVAVYRVIAVAQHQPHPRTACSGPRSCAR
jgi:hypothetical protein